MSISVSPLLQLAQKRRQSCPGRPCAGEWLQGSRGIEHRRAVALIKVEKCMELYETKSKNVSNVVYTFGGDQVWGLSHPPPGQPNAYVWASMEYYA